MESTLDRRLTILAIEVFTNVLTGHVATAQELGLNDKENNVISTTVSYAVITNKHTSLARSR